MNEQSKKLCGLVLAGGLSRRMREDKSLIEYHGTSQVQYCAKLLSQFCKHIYVSNRDDQKNLDAHMPFEQIHDTYENIGPLGGILTAMTRYPRKSWLVLACDLPFVNTAVIDHLIKHRNQDKFATAYKTKEGLPEPLCAIYEPTSHQQIKKFYHEGVYCPRKILTKIDTELIEQIQEGSLNNINSREEYQNALTKINSHEFQK